MLFQLDRYYNISSHFQLQHLKIQLCFVIFSLHQQVKSRFEMPNISKRNRVLVLSVFSTKSLARAELSLSLSLSLNIQFKVQPTLTAISCHNLFTHIRWQKTTEANQKLRDKETQRQCNHTLQRQCFSSKLAAEERTTRLITGDYGPVGLLQK